MPKKDYIERYSAQVNLVQAAHAADIGRAREALKKRAVINQRDVSALRLTPLLCCVLRHNLIDANDNESTFINIDLIFEFADFLIKNGADRTMTCAEGYTYKQHANNLKRKYKMLCD